MLSWSAFMWSHNIPRCVLSWTASSSYLLLRMHTVDHSFYYVPKFLVWSFTIQGKCRKGNTEKFFVDGLHRISISSVIFPTLSYDVLLPHVRVVRPQQSTKRLILCLSYASRKETFKFKLSYTFVKQMFLDNIVRGKSVGKSTQETFFPGWPAQIQVFFLWFAEDPEPRNVWGKQCTTV